MNPEFCLYRPFLYPVSMFFFFPVGLFLSSGWVCFMGTSLGKRRYFWSCPVLELWCRCNRSAGKGDVEQRAEFSKFGLVYAKYGWAMESHVTLYCCIQLYIDRSINLTHNIRRGTKTICILNFNHATHVFCPKVLRYSMSTDWSLVSFSSVATWRMFRGRKGRPLAGVGWTWFHRFSPLESPYFFRGRWPSWHVIFSKISAKMFFEKTINT